MTILGKFPKTIRKVDDGISIPQWLPYCVLDAKRDKVILFNPSALNQVASAEDNYGTGGCPPYFIVDFQGVLGHSILFNVELQYNPENENLCGLLIGELLVMVQSMKTGEWSVHNWYTFDYTWVNGKCEPPQANAHGTPIPKEIYTVRVAARIGIKGFFAKPPLKIGAFKMG